MHSHRIRPTGKILALTLAAVACSRGVSRIETRTLPSPNPTTYSFALPVEAVRAAATEAFSIRHQLEQPVFGRLAPGNIHLESVLAAECSTNAVFGQAVFRTPANANDIYLHTFHTPFVLSSVYRGPEGGLPFIAAFHLHLTGSASGTVVTVTVTNAEVIKGTKFGFASCGPGQAWNCEAVKPTTVEEYTLLRYLGAYLGITNMPPLILPRT